MFGYAWRLAKEVACLWHASGLPPALPEMTVEADGWTLEHDLRRPRYLSGDSTDPGADVESMCRQVSAGVGLPVAQSLSSAGPAADLVQRIASLSGAR
jgi:hypothetical protein